jgi:hypothetical protein
MSHMVQIELKITELDALEKACARLGLELRRNQTRFAWYGQFLGDSSGLAAQGVSEADYDKCDHAIGRRGTTPQNSTTAGGADSEYEIGVIALPDGGYTLRFDYWGPGQKLAQLCGGNELKKLSDEYAYAVAESYLLSEGYEVNREVHADGSLVCVGVQ